MLTRSDSDERGTSKRTEQEHDPTASDVPNEEGGQDADEQCHACSIASNRSQLSVEYHAPATNGHARI
jgi:hypothetical protein